MERLTMADPLFSDSATRAAQTALDGLSLRQEMIGRNLANVDTPGYQAQAVTFEDALQRVERGAQPIRMAVTDGAHLGIDSERTAMVRLAPRLGGSTRADGNNVDVDQELTQMAETGIRFQALSQLVSKKLLLLKSIATGR
jgi:flagellar basal-body rod protein FlgB